MAKLVWNPDSVNRNARQLTDGLVDMLNSVERPLRRIDLPEMPAAVSGSVRSDIVSAITCMSTARVVIALIAKDLRRRTAQAEAVEVEPMRWWVGLGRSMVSIGRAGLETNPMTAPHMWALNHRLGLEPQSDDFIVGFAQGSYDLGAGLLALGRAGLETNPMTAPQMWALNHYMGWTPESQRLAEGLGHSVMHPLETAETIVRWDLLVQGKGAEWLGYQTPGAIGSALTGGTFTATRATASAARASRVASRADGATRSAMGTAINENMTARARIASLEQQLAAAKDKLAGAQQAAQQKGNRQAPTYSSADVSAAQREVNNLRFKLQLQKADQQTIAASRLADFDAAATQSAAARAAAIAARREALEEIAQSTGTSVALDLNSSADRLAAERKERDR